MQRNQNGNSSREMEEEDGVNHPPSNRRHLGVMCTQMTFIKYFSIGLDLEDTASSNTVMSLYLTCLTLTVHIFPGEVG